MIHQPNLSDKNTPTVEGTDNPTLTNGTEKGTKASRRSWTRLIMAVFVIIIITLVTVLILREDNSPSEVVGAESINFAEVIITDLIQEDNFWGTLGSISDDPIRTQLGGTVTWIAEPGDTVGQGEPLFEINGKPVVLLYGDLPAFRDITIGESSLTVSSQPGGTITWVPERGSLIQQGDALYGIDNQPVVALYGDMPAYRSLYDKANEITVAELAVLNAEIALYNAEQSFETVEEQYNSLWVAPEWLATDYELKQKQLAIAQADLASAQSELTSLQEANKGDDVLQLEKALTALGFDADSTLVVDGVFTTETTRAIIDFQAANGLEQDGVVNLGEVVFIPGLVQVLEQLATPGNQSGGVVMTITTGEPASGIDVLQLEEALVSLGYDASGDLIADGTYALETTRSLLSFQEATGLETDGIIDAGEIVFLPGMVLITNQLVAGGSSVSPGSAVLGISLSPKVVRIDLPADKQGLLVAGDVVIVEMPDLVTEVPATVLSVSQTAKQADYGPATFDVLIELDDPSSAEGLDEAPVQVIVVSDSVEDVMAIPVSALVALLEGGYAVELDVGDGITQLVAVEVGFFGENGMIEIISESLQPGNRVVVP